MIPGVILAGGAGRRIGGSKPEALLGQRPLWAHVADRIAPQVSALVANSAGPVGDLAVIPDEVAGRGPLAGIHAAMQWAAGQGAERVLTCAVDTPFLPHDLVERLSGPEAEIAMAITDDGAHGTTAVWRTDLAGDLRAALVAGTRKVTEFTATRQVASVHFPDSHPEPFFNINTPEDLAQAQGWL